MASIYTLPSEFRQKLQRELGAGESVTWAAQPNPIRRMKSGFRRWLFYLPWTAFAVLWIAKASDFQLPRLDAGWSSLPIFGIPFLLIGLGGLISPLWLLRKAHSTIYAITNRRAISIEGARTTTVRSYRPEDIMRVDRTEHRDGTGDLTLWTEKYRDSDGDQQTERYGFFAIPNVRQVQNLLEALRARHARSETGAGAIE